MAVGANALPQSVIQEALADQAGRTMNFVSLAKAVRRLNQWYEDKGILGHVRPLLFVCFLSLLPLFLLKGTGCEVAGLCDG